MIKNIKEYFGKRKTLQKFNDYQNGIKAARKEVCNHGYMFAASLITSKYEMYTDEFKNGYKHELNWV